MAMFDKREKDFERKYIHDQELVLKVDAYRNKLLGLWAAGKLGKKAAQAEEYANTLVAAEMEDKGHIVEKLLKDLTHAGVTVTIKDIRVEMERLLAVAKKQIMGAGD
jgi:hypothetical protein